MKALFTLLVITLVTPLSQAWAQALTGTIAAGQMHALAIHADGTLWATGDNSSGQLGTSNNTNQTSWVQVGSATTWVRVSAGGLHSLALQANGTLWAWGDNTYGQLGTSTNVGSSIATPTQVPGIYTQISAGNFHSVALQVNGTLWAWGRNLYGQLGNNTNNGTNNANPTPTQLAGTYTQVVASYDFSLALQPNGTLWAWGRNTYGQLGNTTNNGTDNANPTPAQVGAAVYTHLAAGQYHSLGLRGDGTLWAWGDNIYGQLGNATNTGTDTANPTPTQVAGTYTQLAAGLSHSLALQADGSLLAWGHNLLGQLGSSTNSGTNTANPTPLPVAGTYVQLVAGANHSLGLRADGTLWAWGNNDRGQLGTTVGFMSTPVTSPTQATGTYVQIAAGGFHSLGLTASGTLYAWGSNDTGQLSNAAPTGSGTNINAPTLVTGTYSQVSAGNAHSLALRADGTLWAWGNNSNGQLGIGNTITASTPTQEATQATTWTALATGSAASFSLARTPSGLVFASTGQNGDGQLGDGTTTQATRFDRVSPLSSVQPLPVQLVSFQAVRTGPATAGLSWATATETNSAGFGIERSDDGVAFRTIGFVRAAGNSNSTLTYSFQDNNCTTTAYYRLAQVDVDGSITYSPVEAVAANDGTTALLLVPNPASGPVQALGLPTGTTLAVYDALGRLVRPATTTLDVAGLAAGVYVVRAQAPGQPLQTARLLVE